MDENDEYINKWKVKQLINELNNVKGNGTSMITLILPKDGQISRVQKLLTDEYGKASNIKSHVNKLSVEAAIRSAQDRLKLYNEIPNNGLVICVGTVVDDNNKEKKMLKDFEPFKPINKFVYKCDNKFHTDALVELLDENDKFGFIIVDGSGALYGSLSGTERQILTKFSVDLPKKHSRGGQSSQRFGRIRMEKRHNFLRKVAETATTVFIENDLPNVKGLILAGLSMFKKQLSQSELFDKRLKDIVLTTLDISYGGEAGFSQAIKYSQEILLNVRYLEEIKLLSNYFDELNRDTQKICYGMSDTIYALESGVLDTLIVWENLKLQRIHLINKITEKPEVKYINDDNNKLFCNDENSELQVIETTLLLDWLTNNYKKFGAKLIFITDNSSEGSQFVKGFGGIGGIMRYVLDFPQNNYDDDEFDSDDFI